MLLEFEAGFDSDVALADVRAKVDGAKSELPDDADEPSVNEVNLSLFPVISIALSGDISGARARARSRATRRTSSSRCPASSPPTLQGTRDEVVEIIAEPMLLKSYGVSLDQFAAAAAQGNSLVAAGALEGAAGPLRGQGAGAHRDAGGRAQHSGRRLERGLGHARRRRDDPADVQGRDIDHPRRRPAGGGHRGLQARRRQPDQHRRCREGRRSPSSRRAGRDTIPSTYIGDQSKFIKQMLGDLQNSVVTAILLVAIVILFVLGGRASIFIGIAMPFAFLTGVLGLALIGATMNIVVLFSLILAVGMLVDDAIIVSEFAERRMSEGMKPREAYAFAATRMSGPVTAATLDPHRGVLPAAAVAGHRRRVHEVPADHADRDAVGVAGGGADLHADARRADRQAARSPARRRRREGPYLKTVRLAIHHPGITLLLAFALLIGVPMVYGKLGKGVEFFPDVEPDTGIVLVHARGNLSLAEKDRLVRHGRGPRPRHARPVHRLRPLRRHRRRRRRRLGGDVTEDVVGQIQFEFVDWQKRPAGEASS